MPEGTKVDDLYKKLLKQGYSEESAAKIAQAQTGEALKTGKPPKHEAMMKHLSITARCAINAEGQGAASGTISMQPAYSGGKMNLEGWDYPCVVEVKSITAASELIPARVGHGGQETDVLGQISVTINGNEVNATGRVTNYESEGPKTVLSMAKKGHQYQASIGGDPGRVEFIASGRELEMNGQTFVGPLYACYDTVLGEISVVSLGADSSTSTRIAAKAAKGLKATMAEEDKKEPMEFGEFCKAAGFDPAVMSDEQKRGMSELHAKIHGAGEGEKEPEPEEDAEKKDKEEKEEKAEAARRAASIQAAAAGTAAMKAAGAVQRRINAIQVKCKEHADIAATAMEENWDDKRIDNEIELKVLRAGRNKNTAPAAHIVGKHVSIGSAIEARFMQAGGIGNDKLVKMFGEPNVVHASHSLSDLGLCDMLRLMAAQCGQQLPSSRGSEFVEKLVEITAKSPCPGYHERMRIQADGGATPLSLPGILSNVAHKLLLEGYNTVEATWRAVSKQTSAQDFRPQNRFRLSNDMRFRPLNTDGELRHGKLGEQAYIVQPDTQGIMFNLDRKLIINDDLSAFSEMPKTVGRGAGLAINNDFWTLWLSNPNTTDKFSTSGTDALQTASAAFFSTTFNNYLSGTTVGTNDSRLNVEGLSRAYTKQLQQIDPAGYPLGIEPSVMLVPASLRYTAESLMLSRILVSSVSTGSTNNNLQPSENPLAGKFKVCASAYLDNANFSGYSTTAWYLLLDPDAGFDCIEAAFLNGMQTPIVERAEANFENLGIRFRSWIDFGLTMKETRGGIMSAGA